jgi:hypothetical protein
VNVNKTGHYKKPLSVNFGFAAIDRTGHRHNATTPYRDIGYKWRPTVAIEYRPVADNSVVNHWNSDMM